MNPRVRNAKPAPDYKVDLEFTNGEHGTFDCSPLLESGVFRELKDIDYFRQLKVQAGTVVWPHEQDICPDTLYEESVKTR